MNAVTINLQAPGQQLSYSCLKFSVYGGNSVNSMILDGGCAVHFSPQMIRFEAPVGQSWFCRFDDRGILLNADGSPCVVDGVAARLGERGDGRERVKTRINLWDIMLGRSSSVLAERRLVDRRTFGEMLAPWIVGRAGEIPECYAELSLGRKHGEAMLEIGRVAVPVHLSHFSQVQKGYVGGKILASPAIVNGLQALNLFDKTKHRYVGTLFWDGQNRRFYHIAKVSEQDVRGYPVVIDRSHQVEINGINFRFSAESRVGTVYTLYFDDGVFERATFRTDPLEATPVFNDGVATSYIFGRKIGGRYMDGISGRLSRKLKVVKIADGRVWIPFASKTLLLTDDAIATLGVSPGDEVEVDIEDGFITEVHADSVVAKPTLLRDPLAGNAVRASIFGSKLGVKLNSLPLVIENARTFSVGRHWEVVTGRKFKIGRAGMNFRNRRISAYIGADGEVLYWKEADRLTELENAMIAAHAKFSSDRRGLVSNDVFVSREFRPMIQRLGWAVQSNNRADWAPGIAELLNSSELSVSQCIDALAFMQKQVYSAGWSMQKYRVVADEFERVLSMLGDDRREAIQFVLSQPMMQRFLQLFIS